MKQFFDKFVQPLHKRVQEEGTSFVVVIIVLVVVFVLSGSFIARFRQDLHGSVMVNSFDFGLAKDDVFADVSRNHVNSFALAYLKGHGMVASGRDFFRPDEFATRAEFMKMLTDVLRVYPYKLSYGNCFNDVGDLPGDWFAPSVCAAKHHGWVKGYEDGGFDPARNINKAEGLKIILKAFKFDIPDNSAVALIPYSDIAPDAWYLGVARAGVDDGIVAAGDSFNASWELTRGDVVEMIYNAMKAKGLM